jgi:hypothetical protein
MFKSVRLDSLFGEVNLDDRFFSVILTTASRTVSSFGTYSARLQQNIETLKAFHMIGIAAAEGRLDGAFLF